MFVMQRWQDGGMRFRQDGPAAGSAVAEVGDAAVAEPVETEPVEETADETPEQPEETNEVETPTADDTQESDGESTQGKPAAKPKSAEKMVPLSVLIEERQKNKARMDAIEQQIAALKPPEKDPIDALVESLPAEDDAEYQPGIKAGDIRTLAPILKALREQINPKSAFFDKAFAATAQGMDRLKFLVEQVIETLPKDSLPLGIKHLDKIDAHRKDVFEKSGRKSLPTHKDAFDAVMEQVKAEAEQANQTEAAVRKDERSRTVKEVLQRKSASSAGGPGNARPVPRGGSPGKRSFDQLERSGGDFALP